jgi:hypothetical protein
MTRNWNDQQGSVMVVASQPMTTRQMRMDAVRQLLEKGLPMDDALFIGDPDNVLTEKDRQMLKA